MDYDSLLKRGKAEQPDKARETSRFKVPAVKLQTQGKKTIIANFNEICDAINRDPGEVATYLLKEIGTAGSRVESRLVLSGSFKEDELNMAIKKYIESHVICKECHLPDTKIIKEDRKYFILCEACGTKYQLR